MGESVLDEKGSKLAAASTEVQNLRLMANLILVADLNDALSTHEWLSNGLLMSLNGRVLEGVDMVDSFRNGVGVGNIHGGAVGAALAVRCLRAHTSFGHLSGQGHFPHLELNHIKALNLGSGREASLA